MAFDGVDIIKLRKGLQSFFVALSDSCILLLFSAIFVDLCSLAHYFINV